jgi:hypothetical protein
MTERLIEEIENYKEHRNMKMVLENRWLSMFMNLVEFKEENGHTNVPAKYKKYKPLGNWIHRQRGVFQEGKLDPLRQHLLKLLGFNFRLMATHEWDEMFQKLVEFKKQFGHANIKESYSDSQLYYWLKYQRSLYWIGKLEARKLKKLKQLGVDMQNKTIDRWENKFAKLIKFKKKHRHLYVSTYFTSDKQLVTFVKVLRRQKENMPVEHRKALDELGFIWNPGKELTVLLNRKRGDEAWMKRFEELKTFKAQYGTCRVLTTSTTHHSLGNWVSVQRNSIENLTADKIKLLTSIGFFEDNKLQNPIKQS